MRQEGSASSIISIVTPTCNQGQFIEETIVSVLLHGLPRLDVLQADTTLSAPVGERLPGQLGAVAEAQLVRAAVEGHETSGLSPARLVFWAFPVSRPSR